MFKFELFTLDADDVGNISMFFCLSTLLSVPRNLHKEKTFMKIGSRKGREHTTHIPSMEFREKLWQHFFPKSLLGLVNNYKANFHRWILKLLILFCFPILYKLRHLLLNCLNFTGTDFEKVATHRDSESTCLIFANRFTPTVRPYVLIWCQGWNYCSFIAQYISVSIDIFGTKSCTLHQMYH